MDNQVAQRGPDDRAHLRLSGVARSIPGHTIEARVLRRGVPVEELDWSPIARVASGGWKGELAGVPVGGPYRVEVRVAGETESAAVHDVLVGDLWILGGQSNMQGYGDLVDVEPPHALVHSFDLADRWQVAEEPLHTTVNAVDSFHWSFRSPDRPPVRYDGERLRRYVANRTKGAGLGLPFAVEMVRRTGIPVGLIPCAHGATKMDVWDPALKDQGGASLYGSMLRRFHAAGGKIKGMLWYQGESDSGAEDAPVFQKKFERFVMEVRKDFGQPDLPFYYVQLGRLTSPALPGWNVVQEAQRLAELNLANAGMVAAIDNELDDGIHVGAQSLKLLGRRLARLACHDKRGPRPVAVTCRDHIVRVAFSEVNGRLRTQGRLSGFTIHTSEGDLWPHVYRQRLDPADANAVLLDLTNEPPEGAVLRYGYGNDPYCNLADEAGMAAPAFGPIRIPK